LVEEPHVPYKSSKRSKMEKRWWTFLQSGLWNGFFGFN
jgi:hypothetical protein